MSELKPVIVNGVDITKVEGADIVNKTDEWYHSTEMEMIGDNDEKTSVELIEFLNKQKYKLPTLDINGIINSKLQ